jgi:general secretion pathway protein A
MASALDHLKADELSEMILFRWNVASGGKKPPFTEGALQAIFEHSEGIPREATILADNALLWGYFNNKQEIDKETVDAAASDRHLSLSKLTRKELFDRGS